MDMEFVAFSESGVRRCNQDAWRVVETPKRTIMVVSDGMGGHSMGDVAAETVCNAVCCHWEENPENTDSADKVFTACAKAAEALYSRSRVVRPIEMGTTFVMASVEGDVATIAHCGDSRCYLLRDGEVVFQTTDHCDPLYGSEVVSRCFFSFNPQDAVPDVVQLQVQPGDRIFLCSDGVYKSMAPQILSARLQDDKPLDAVVDVIKFMCEKFSTDNYTGILAQVK